MHPSADMNNKTQQPFETILQTKSGVNKEYVLQGNKQMIVPEKNK